MMTQREHVYGLAAANGIKVNEHADYTYGDSSADWQANEIHVARLDDDKAYAAALHELGHLIAPGGSLRRGEAAPKNKLEALGYQLHEEAVAWQWAKANAIGWNAEMQATLVHAFSTYEKPHRDAKEEEVLTIAAKFLKPSGMPKAGQAAAFFKAGGKFGAPVARNRKPVTDLNNTPLTPEAKAFEEFKKMFEGLFQFGNVVVL